MGRKSFLSIFGFGLVCAKFAVIIRDFRGWLLGDFVLDPSKNIFFSKFTLTLTGVAQFLSLENVNNKN